MKIHRTKDGCFPNLPSSFAFILDVEVLKRSNNLLQFFVGTEERERAWMFVCACECAWVCMGVCVSEGGKEKGYFLKKPVDSYEVTQWSWKIFKRKKTRQTLKIKLFSCNKAKTKKSFYSHNLTALFWILQRCKLTSTRDIISTVVFMMM